MIDVWMMAHLTLVPQHCTQEIFSWFISESGAFHKNDGSLRDEMNIQLNYCR
jgi:hypothetical protein